MKKLILAVAMLTAVPAWAEPCRVYEYAEMKDMTDAELQAELTATSRASLANLQRSNKWAAIGGRRGEMEADKLFEDSIACRKQNDRLRAIEIKRRKPAAEAAQ